MPKITFIGAGSLVFTRNLCNDILLTPALEGSTLSLVDIDAERLEGAKRIVEALVRHRGEKTGVKATVEATLDRKAALKGADYVVTTFQQGGLEAYSPISKSRSVTASSSASVTHWDQVASSARSAQSLSS